MRIAIVSANNSDYINYWGVIKTAWLKLGITPVLIFVGHNENADITVPIIPGVPESCQAQVARWYATRYFQDDLVLTSDIDMMPLQGKYFHDAFDQYVQNSVSILSHDAYELDSGMEAYPMCYNIATGIVFTKLLNLQLEWPEWIKSLEGYNYGWQTDEAFFYHQVKKTGIPVKPYKRGWNRESGEANLRIDRNTWHFDEQKVREKHYIDAHLLRPYKENEGEIIKLLNLI